MASIGLTLHVEHEKAQRSIRGWYQSLVAESDALEALRDMGSMFPTWLWTEDGDFPIAEWIEAKEARLELERTAPMVERLSVESFGDADALRLFLDEYSALRDEIEEIERLGGGGIWFSPADDLDPPEEECEILTWKKMAKDKSIEPSLRNFRRFVDALERYGERGGQDINAVADCGSRLLANESQFPDMIELLELKSYLPCWELSEIHTSWCAGRETDWRLPPQMRGEVERRLREALTAPGAISEHLFELFMKPLYHQVSPDEVEQNFIADLWVAFCSHIPRLDPAETSLYGFCSLVEPLLEHLPSDRDYIVDYLSALEADWTERDLAYADLPAIIFRLAMRNCPPESIWEALGERLCGAPEHYRQSVGEVIATLGSIKEKAEPPAIRVDPRWFDFVNSNIEEKWDGHPRRAGARYL